MKTHLRFFILIIGIYFFTSCCLYRTHFTMEEIQWLQPYEEGDKMVFQSENGELDTTWIVLKSINHGRCYYSSFRPHMGLIYYKDNNQSLKDGVSLIKTYKSPDYTWLMIKYHETRFIVRDTTDLFNYRLNDELYRFCKAKSEISFNQLRCIYWHKDHGIIKYITHEGVEWKRINLDFEVE